MTQDWKSYSESESHRLAEHIMQWLASSAVYSHRLLAEAWLLPGAERVPIWIQITRYVERGAGVGGSGDGQAFHAVPLMQTRIQNRFHAGTLPKPCIRLDVVVVEEFF